MSAVLDSAQLALLRLVLERDFSYADLAELLGVGREEVRQRARGAIAALSASEIDREVQVTDYLLGQADPIERADVVNSLRTDPDLCFEVRGLVLKLRLLTPAGALPDLPRCEAGDPRGSRRPGAELGPPGSSAARDAIRAWLRPVRRAAARLGPRRALVAAVVALMTVVLASEMVVPSLLEAKLRGKLAELGSVEDVDLGSFPAVKSLWGDIDSLAVSLADADAEQLFGAGGIGHSEGGEDRMEMLDRLAATDQLEIGIDRLQVGEASLEDVAIDKSGSLAHAQFAVGPGEVGGMLPLAGDVDVEASARGNRLSLLLRGGPLRSSSQRMDLYAEGGGVVGALDLDAKAKRALGVPAGADLPPQPIFSSDQVSVDSLSAQPSGDRLLVDVEATLADEDLSEVLPGGAPPDPAAAAPPSVAGGVAPPPQAPPPAAGASAPAELPPDFARCLAEQGVDLPEPGAAPPAGLDQGELQRAAVACAEHLPSGSLPVPGA